jgi:hypothetical protein
MKLFVLLMAVGVALAQSAPEEEREKRQSGYYQGQGVARGPPAKQFPVTRFPGVGGPSPQGFQAAPVDEDDEEDVVSRNTVAPSTGPQALLLVRQSHPTPQPQQIYRKPIATDSSRDYQQAIPVARQHTQQVRRPPPQQQGGRGGQYANQQLQASASYERMLKFQIVGTSVVTPCSFVGGYRCFEGTHRLHHHYPPKRM